MPLTAVIVDDESLARQELQYLLEQSGEVEVLAQGTNGIEAVDLIQTRRPDLVFLDVQMPGLDGFAVLRKLIERHIPIPQVVFATAFNQYAVRAFEVNAVDYLLKPFDSRRVAQTVEKALARTAAPSAESSSEAKLDALLSLLTGQVQSGIVQSGAPSGASPAAPGIQAAAPATGKVVLRTHNRLLLVDQREICFATIEDGTISVTTPTLEGHSNFRTLDDLAAQLDPAIFWRTHRSWLVNLHHIREVVPWFNSSYQLRMDDPKKTEIPVSRSQTGRLRQLFNL